MKRSILAAVVLAALAGCTQHDTVTVHHGNPITKPCASEDAKGPCVWLAYAHGNGSGRSFVVDAKGKVRHFGPVEGNPQGWKPFRDVEGHKGCMILVGPTSRVRCADGWESES